MQFPSKNVYVTNVYTSIARIHWFDQKVFLRVSEHFAQNESSVGIIVIL